MPRPTVTYRSERRKIARRDKLIWRNLPRRVEGHAVVVQPPPHAMLPREKP